MTNRSTFRLLPLLFMAGAFGDTGFKPMKYAGLGPSGNPIYNSGKSKMRKASYRDALKSGRKKGYHKFKKYK